MKKAAKRVTTIDGRGETVATAAGAKGIRVGTLNGCAWVAWGDADFAAMCKAFDAQVAKAK